MIREEAVEILKSTLAYDSDFAEAKQMAIEALEQESRTMNDIVMRFKSGREFRFKCEEYTIKRFKLDGTLSEFSYEGGVGECPIYFQEQDIECIAVIGKEQNNEDR